MRHQKKKISAKPLLEINSAKNTSFDWHELWRYRDLFFFLVWRNFKVRYKQTFLGLLWIILQPLITMAIISLVLGRLARFPSDGVPYPIFLFTALVFWNYFSVALTSTSNSLIEGQALVKKIYFPRIIIPFATAVTQLVDLVINILILFALMAVLRFEPNYWGILTLPLVAFVTFVLSTGLGLVLAAANTTYRDVRYLIGFFVQILFYLSPIIYSASLVPAKYQWIYYLNPVAGILTFARQSLLHHVTPNWSALLIGLAIGIVLTIFGWWYFHRVEKSMVDVL